MRFAPSSAAWVLASALAGGATLEFNRDVRPILSKNCFHCHGQDPAHRDSGLRLDTEEGLHGNGESGDPVIVPGDPEKSLLWKRITSKDPEVVMPPPDSHRSLTGPQIETLRQWIVEGASYQKHWAFVSPTKKPLPKTDYPAAEPWDAWVHAKLATQDLTPSPPASPARWLRRASFDLTGLAPTPEETAAFEEQVTAKGEAAYETAVDRLLSSKRYGEHMAAAWLDVARYADTHGFNNDSSRSMWRWRDWVIDAFNGNLAYDRFVTMQLAGDLLPDADLESRIATGFNRNHVINSEGGIIDEEYRVEYVADRVRTVSTAWLGLTMECARCHDHKYDNVSQKDYYRMFAFFNQVPEVGEAGRLRNAAPVMRAPTREQQDKLAKLDEALARATAELPEIRPEGDFTPPPVEADKERMDLVETLESPTKDQTGHATQWKPGAGPAHTFAAWVRWQGEEGVIFSSINYGGEPSAQGYARGVELRVLSDGRLDFRASERWPGYANELRSSAKLQTGRWHFVALVNEGGSKNEAMRLYVDDREEEMELVLDGLSGGARAGAVVLGKARGGTPDEWNGTIAMASSWPKALKPEDLGKHLDSTLKSDSPWTRDRSDLVTRRQALASQTEYRSAWSRLESLRAEKFALQRSLPNTMVMTELDEPRPTYLLERGTYDAHGEQVEAGALEDLLLAWPQGAPRNRLGLARWLTDPQHPLTARVVVNRFWQQVFGTGLVKTAEDLGVQGEYPSHPELLDWLARDFIESGWDVKRLMKSLVLSSTYRQDSAQKSGMTRLDPENRLLARGPRVRLDAECIRDHALNTSGLLVEKVGGPSVRPFQPADYYKGMVVGANYPSTTWTDGTGDELFRRSLYTFWKRTVPHPVTTNFDMPDREFCVATRSRTNTPLQALTLMNEKGMLYAAAALGARIRSHSPEDTKTALAYGFELTTGREPTAEEARVLRQEWDTSLADWQSDPEAAKAFLSDCGVAQPTDPPTEAAYTLIGNLLLNLDETITKH
ncbi:hypothetical protein HAHE_01640 [Haloferula helveola]|uniref:Planctomycete cytochrome C n=1 Tax=Haloferula helveola TaxID=490095 RepID=A0ABM7R6R7_9BACT|nr:hypothetical protein HAHE_01640 [Haloferula helveola]